MSENMPGDTSVTDVSNDAPIARRIGFSALLAALISVCAFFSVPIPVSPVPIVLQNMMAVLSGEILGSVYGGLSVFIFLAAGAVGLPVFSGGGGGLARFASPTGGFLVGYLLSAIVSGLFFIRKRRRFRPRYWVCLLSSVCGFVTIYVPGILFYMLRFGKTLEQALAVCLVPFIVPDLIKIALASLIAFRVRPTACLIMGIGEQRGN